MSYKTALVTGASSGLGRGLAQALAKQGTFVVLAARRQSELDSAVGEIEAADGQARAVCMDVAQTDATVRQIRALDSELGGFDLIIANAGIGTGKRSDSFKWEAIASQVRVNFDGAIATLTAVLPDMIERRRGHLVGISSLAGLSPLPRAAAYCASKAGLSMYLASLQGDVAKYGVTVTTVEPGFVKTPLTADIKHAMPQLLELDDAVARIVKALGKRSARVVFPQPLAMLTMASAHLPAKLRAKLLS